MLLRDKVSKLRDAILNVDFHSKTLQIQINNIEQCLEEGKLEHINYNFKLIKDKLETISTFTQESLKETK